MDDSSRRDDDHAVIQEVQAANMDREDAEFYRDRAGRVEGPVLELGCGTGRVYLRLLEAGIDVDGLDRSATVLATLRKHAAERDLAPTVWQADMTDFSVDRGYDLVFSAFNTIQNASTVDDQLTVLASVYDALAPGGQFVFDTFVPRFDVICETYGHWQTDSLTYDGTSYDVRSRTELDDELQQSIYVRTELEPTDEDQEVYTSAIQQTMLPYQHVELLARQSPFDTWHVNGDFEDRPVADGDAVQVWTLERNA